MDSLRDCCLITEDGTRFMIHRANLCNCSQYFTDLFCGDLWRDKKEVQMTEISGDTMKEILNFIYSGNISVNEKNICDILKAANRFLLENLLAKFNGFILENTSISNCVELTNLTTALSYLKMDNFCLSFLKANFDQVVDESNDFLQLSSANWLNLLNDNSTIATDVKVIWQSVVKWFQVDANRLTFLPDLLHRLIPICNSLDKAYASTILMNPIVTTNDKYDDILRDRQRISDTVKPSQLFPLCIIGNSPTRKHLNGLIIMGKQAGRNYQSNFTPYATYMAGNVLYMIDRNKGYNKHSLYAANPGTPDTRTAITHIAALSVCHFGSQIFAFGGIDEEEPDVTVRVLDTHTHSWLQKPSMPFIFRDSSAGSLNGKIYVFGSKVSKKDGDVASRKLYGLVYDPVQERWSKVAAPSVFRKQFLLVSHCGFFYAIGGVQNDVLMRTVEKYDASLDQWTLCAELTYDFAVPRAVAFGNLLFVYEDVLQYHAPMNIRDPIYLNPVSNEWVIFPENLFLELLKKFLVCVVKLLSGHWM